MNIQTFDFSINLMRNVLWQYDSAERLIAWIQNKQYFLDENHETFWNNWIADVFNIDSSNEFGLAVWAIILDVPLLINEPIVNPNKEGWGFGEFRENFNNGNFNISGTGAQFLSVEQRRLVLKMRYQYLVSSGTVPEINQILVNAFGALGDVWVIDNQDMTIVYNFDFVIPPWVEFVMENLNVVPTPSGVSHTIVGL